MSDHSMMSGLIIVAVSAGIALSAFLFIRAGERRQDHQAHRAVAKAALEAAGFTSAAIIADRAEVAGLPGVYIAYEPRVRVRSRWDNTLDGNRYNATVFDPAYWSWTVYRPGYQGPVMPLNRRIVAPERTRFTFESLHEQDKKRAEAVAYAIATYGCREWVTILGHSECTLFPAEVAAWVDEQITDAEVIA